MAAETVRKFEALEAQAQLLMSVFTKAGHEAVAPAIIQPAGVFLDVIGEALRARTYVFNDPDGAELCLRPDLTVPACRLHIARHANPATPARYCYNGPAFRFEPQGIDAAHPREFRQAGIERFGDTQREIAEAETIALMLNALDAAGLETWTLQLGDLGLFSAVLDAVALPARWKKRLGEAFMRPNAFRHELRQLTTAPADAARRIPADLLAMLDREDFDDSEARVAGYFEENSIEVIGTRTIREMTAHLLDIAADAAAKPLDPQAASLIEAYVAISGEASTSGEKIAGLLKGTKGGVGAALDTYDRRLALLGNLGLDLKRVQFSAEFGRTFEYYTGLVFEIVAPGRSGAVAVAGGGRYDRLMRAAGSPVDVPGVGGAIHTERLLGIANGGGA